MKLLSTAVVLFAAMARLVHADTPNFATSDMVILTKAGPSGIWKHTLNVNGQPPVVTTLALKLEGDKLTGAFIGSNGRQESVIEGGKFSDGKISFNVARPFGKGGVMNMTYQGTVKGDTINGTVNYDLQGGNLKGSAPWFLKRAKD